MLWKINFFPIDYQHLFHNLRPCSGLRIAHTAANVLSSHRLSPVLVSRLPSQRNSIGQLQDPCITWDLTGLPSEEHLRWQQTGRLRTFWSGNSSLELIYIFYIFCASTQTHQLLREHATECYENCCDEGCPLADADGWAGISIFNLSILKQKHFLAQSGSTKRVAELTLPQPGLVGQALWHSRQAVGPDPVVWQNLRYEISNSVIAYMAWNECIIRNPSIAE